MTQTEVYCANYLRYIARARSDWAREIGIDQLEMKAAGVVFAVRRVEADYIAPEGSTINLRFAPILRSSRPRAWL